VSWRRCAVSEPQEEYFDADGPTTLICFKVVDGTLMVTLTLFTNWPESGDESETIDRISRLVARCFGDVAQSWTTLP